MNVKFFALTFVFLITPSAHAKPFVHVPNSEGKFFFTENGPDVSPCKKVGPKKSAELAKDPTCVLFSGAYPPLLKAVGKCGKPGKKSLYLFFGKEECEEAQKDTSNGAAS